VLVTGAGDLLSALMSAAVSALGIRMFKARKLLELNWRSRLNGIAHASSFFTLSPSIIFYLIRKKNSSCILPHIILLFVYLSSFSLVQLKIEF